MGVRPASPAPAPGAVGQDTSGRGRGTELPPEEVGRGWQGQEAGTQGAICTRQVEERSI